MITDNSGSHGTVVGASEWVAHGVAQGGHTWAETVEMASRRMDAEDVVHPEVPEGFVYHESPHFRLVSPPVEDEPRLLRWLRRR